MDDLKQIGLTIKKLRKKKKISQESLAEAISMNYRSIVRIENQHNLPTIETLDKIAKALDVKITDFFETPAFKNKQEIISKINTIAEKMSFEELEKFYKAFYNFYS